MFSEYRYLFLFIESNKDKNMYFIKTYKTYE